MKIIVMEGVGTLCLAFVLKKKKKARPSPGLIISSLDPPLDLHPYIHARPVYSVFFKTDRHTDTGLLPSVYMAECTMAHCAHCRHHL